MADRIFLETHGLVYETILITCEEMSHDPVADFFGKQLVSVTREKLES